MNPKAFQRREFVDAFRNENSTTNNEADIGFDVLGDQLGVIAVFHPPCLVKGNPSILRQSTDSLLIAVALMLILL
jgi:hypothetical protein